jgi:hypothetical protein
MHRFHRYDNVVAGETDRARSGITVTELKHALPVQNFFVYELAVKLCRSSVSVVPIVASRITADLQSQLCIKTCDFIQSG